MFAIGIHYLNGSAMAKHPASHERPEWPPHPDRVFMVLAAAFFETGEDAAERQALEWLEELEPPSLVASDATFRKPHNGNGVVTAFVPVNDTNCPKAPQLGKGYSEAQLNEGLSLLPDRRSRQPRQFPVAIPDDPTVHLIWPDDPPEELRGALAQLCRKVTYLGHSASLVQMWVSDSPPAPNWVPTSRHARHQLRITSHGRLENLGMCFNRAERDAYGSLKLELKADPSPKRRREINAELKERFDKQEPLYLRPTPSLWQGYGQPIPPDDGAASPRTVFDHDIAILTRVAGRRLGLETTLQLTEVLHKTVLKTCPDSVPEWVSGHRADGAPSETPHLAFFPLPFVGREHADGHLLGIALAIPRQVRDSDVVGVLREIIGLTDEGLPHQTRLFGGDRFGWVVEPEQREDPPYALRVETWTGPAQRWATVTPVVFDRHPKGADRERQAKEMIAMACERIGLPRPNHVTLTPTSLHVGVPIARRFPQMRRKLDGGARNHTHAVIGFDAPVLGPVLIGAGRYRGYGLCRPVRWEEGG